MIAWLRHVLSPAFLYAQNAVPTHDWTALHLGWLVLLLLGALLALRAARSRPTGHTTAGLYGQAAAFVCAAVLLMAQRHTAGPLSARIWALGASAVALGLFLMRWARSLRLPAAWAPPIRALACDLFPDDEPLPRRLLLPWLLAHALGLALLAWAEALMWPPAAWLPLLCALACLAAAWWGDKNAHRRWRWELWAPLGLAYIGGLLRWGVSRGLELDVSAYQAFPYPDPWSLWFDARVATLAACAWMFISTGVLLRRSAGVRWFAYGLLGLALGWYAAVVLRHLSHGATGSDPFCYLQMAADLATAGTPQHAFPLASLARAADVPVWPVAPVGYHPPAVELAPTVWPIGWPLLLAPLYALGGELLALWGAPLWWAAVALLTYRLARDLAPQAGRVGAALAAALLLSSYEGVTRSLVPMADAAATGLGVGLLCCLWRARQRDALRWSALAGFCWGWVYLVRHPNVGLGLAALPALLANHWTSRRRWQHLMVYGGAALLLAGLDLAYHTRVFAAPWITESHEWDLLSWWHIGPSTRAMLEDGWLRRNEWGYFWPLIVYGAWRQARSPAGRPAAALLWAGLIPVLGFHLCYNALRLRDLLPLFPWAALWASSGAADLWATATSASRARWRAVLACTLALALAARSTATLGLPWASDVGVFGHVSASQREAYGALAETLPANAVVATGLNSGALARYSARLTFRPAAWAADEFARFARALEEAGYRLYFLDDGEEMAHWCRSQPVCARALPVAAFDIPTFGLGGQDLDRPAFLLSAP